MNQIKEDQKKKKSQQVRMGPLHPADSQSHAGSLGHQFQSSLETPAKLHLHKLSHFFFFFQKDFFSQLSALLQFQY